MRLATLLLTLPLAVACTGGTDLGDAAGKAGADTRLLKDAQGAANEVIRNATDCPAAKAAYAAAKTKLDAADAAVKTATGRTTLQALRQQVQRVMDACP